MEALRDAADFPPTEEGLRALVTETLRALNTQDSPRLAQLSELIEPDATRMELSLTFEGNRLLSANTLAHAHARWEARRRELNALRSPHTITLASTLGSELSDGSPHGLDPQIPSVARYLRPHVRFYLVRVTGTDGSYVNLSPFAFAAGRWTWLAEPWTELTLTTQVSGPSAAH